MQTSPSPAEIVWGETVYAISSPNAKPHIYTYVDGSANPLNLPQTENLEKSEVLNTADSNTRLWPDYESINEETTTIKSDSDEQYHFVTTDPTPFKTADYEDSISVTSETADSEDVPEDEQPTTLQEKLENRTTELKEFEKILDGREGTLFPEFSESATVPSSVVKTLENPTLATDRKGSKSSLTEESLDDQEPVLTDLSNNSSTFKTQISPLPNADGTNDETPTVAGTNDRIPTVVDGTSSINEGTESPTVLLITENDSSNGNGTAVINVAKPTGETEEPAVKIDILGSTSSIPVVEFETMTTASNIQQNGATKKSLSVLVFSFILLLISFVNFM